MRIRYTIILLLLTSSMVFCVNENIFPYSRDVQLSENNGSSLGKFILDSECLDKLNNSYSNMRLYEENEVAFMVRTSTKDDSITSVVTSETEILSFIKNKDYSEIIFKLTDKDMIPEKCVVETSARNFENQVFVYGSNDKKRWKLLSENQIIFDYSKYVDLRNTEIFFSKEKFSLYKLVVSRQMRQNESPLLRIIESSGSGTSNITDVSELRNSSIKISDIKCSVEMYKKSHSQSVDIKYPVREFTIEEVEKTSQIILETYREPIKEIKLLTDNEYFYRNVIVYGSEDSNSWSIIKQDVISRYAKSDTRKDHTLIRFSNSVRSHFFRIVIKNEDNVPLIINNTELKGEQKELIFVHNNIESFQLYYGGDSNLRPSYDIVKINLDEFSKFNLYNLKSEKTNPDFESVRDLGQLSKYALWLMILILIPVLIYLLYFSIKKVDKM